MAAFLTSGAAQDDTLIATPLEQWQGFVRASFNRKGRDFVVAEQDGRMVGLLMSTVLDTDAGPLRNARIIVHPDARRQGCYTALRARLEAQHEARPLPLQASCPGTWTVGERLVAREGFVATERLHEMRLPHPRRVAPPPQASTSWRGVGRGRGLDPPERRRLCGHVRAHALDRDRSRPGAGRAGLRALDRA